MYIVVLFATYVVRTSAPLVIWRLPASICVVSESFLRAFCDVVAGLLLLIWLAMSIPGTWFSRALDCYLWVWR